MIAGSVRRLQFTSLTPTDESGIIPNWSTGLELQSLDVDRNCSLSPFVTD